MKKRLLAAIMSLCMIVSLLPVSAFAAPEDGEPVTRIRLMGQDTWRNATFDRAGEEQDLAAPIKYIRLYDGDNDYTISDAAEGAAGTDSFSTTGEYADGAAKDGRIIPSEIDRIAIGFTHRDDVVETVFHKDDFTISYVSGDAEVTTYAEITLDDSAASEVPTGEAVRFYADLGNDITWSLYESVYVDSGANLGDQMPGDPPVAGDYTFIGWEQNSHDGTGAEFTANTVVNADLDVYARKVTDTGGVTDVRVYNVGNDIYQKALEVYSNEYDPNVSIDDIMIDGMSLLGSDDRESNPYYNDWLDSTGKSPNANKWHDNSYFTICNEQRPGSPGFENNWNNRVSPSDIQGIKIYGKVEDREFSFTLDRNELDLRVQNNTRIDIYLGDVEAEPTPDPDEKPDAPTEDTLVDLFNDMIQVTCANKHKTISYGLDDVAGSYSTSSDVTKEEDTWTYTVAVNYNPFVEAYSDDVVDGNDTESHSLIDPNVTTKNVKLIWTEDAWTIAEGQLPVVIETICTNPQADYIQVVMSDAVREKYEEYGLTVLERWTHVDSAEVTGGYYEMGANGRIPNGYNVSENEITGVTMGWTTHLGETMWFPMDRDNGIYAQVEVSYGYEGNAYIMYLYCQLVEERIPDAPTNEDLEGEDGLLAGKITVDCANESHSDNTYGLVSGCYDRPESPIYNSNTNQWEYTITINAQAYANHYATENSYSTHTATSSNQQITLIHDGDKWVAPEQGVTINVTCNGGTDPDPTAHVIHASVGQNGSMTAGNYTITSSASQEIPIADDGKVTFTITPNEEYVVKSITVGFEGHDSYTMVNDGTSDRPITGNPNTWTNYTMPGMDCDQSIHVEFGLDTNDDGISDDLEQEILVYELKDHQKTGTDNLIAQFSLVPKGTNVLNFLQQKVEAGEISFQGYEGYVRDENHWYLYDSPGFAFGENDVVNGWTNVYVNYTEPDTETIWVFAMYDGDFAAAQENKQMLCSFTVPIGTKLYDFLQTQTFPEFPGYTADTTKWYNWDNNGSLFPEDKTVDGWTNVVINYTPNQYKLIYDGNGGSYTTSNGTFEQLTESYPYGREITLYNTTFYFERAGYTNIGWSTDPNAVTADYEGATKILFNNDNFSGLTENGSVTLYAVWEKDLPDFVDPTLPELDSLLNVVMDCSAIPEHGYTYENLDENSYSIESKAVDENGTMSCTVTVNQNYYVNKYNGSFQSSQGIHSMVPAGTGSRLSIDLTRSANGEWTLADTANDSFLINLTCDGSTEPSQEVLEYHIMNQYGELDTIIQKLDPSYQVISCAIRGRDNTFTDQNADGSGWAANHEYYVVKNGTPGTENYVSYDNATSLDLYYKPSSTLTYHSQDILITEPVDGISEVYVLFDIKLYNDYNYGFWYDSDGDGEKESWAVWEAQDFPSQKAHTKAGDQIVFANLDNYYTPTFKRSSEREVVFLGWDFENHTTIYEPGEEPSNLITNSFTLSRDVIEKAAIWAPLQVSLYGVYGYKPLSEEYTLTFDSNGGTTGTWTESVKAGDTLTLDATASWDDQHIFLGWSSNGSVKGQVYGAGDQVPKAEESITPTGDVTVYAIWAEDLNGDKIPDANQIVIRPADITIYTGGTGYEGIVTDEDGSTVSGSEETGNGLPEPGYYLVLPYTLNEKLGDNPEEMVDLSNILRFTYGDNRTWDLVRYNDNDNLGSSSAYGYYIYKMVPAVTGQDPVRLQIKDGDNLILSDEFIFNLDSLFQEYQMSLYTGAVSAGGVKAQLQINGVWTNVDEADANGLCLREGLLTVRGVNEEDVREIESDVSSPVSQITAEADSNVTYYINDSDIPVTNQDGVALLADSLVGEGIYALRAEVQETLGIDENHSFQYKYLDLVDASNGNAYVTLKNDDTVKIHWPMPAGTNANTKFYVVHFDGLDREFDGNSLGDILDSPDVKQIVYSAENGNLSSENGNVVLSTGTFSPFVLVYEDDTTGPVDPDEPGGGESGGGSDSDPTGNLTISKRVSGAAGDREDTFTFTVYLTDEDGDELEANFYYNGSGYSGNIGDGDSITLSGGESITIRNLPVGTRYEVVEEEANEDGYVTTSSGEEGTIRSSQTYTAAFTNTRNAVLATPEETGVDRWLNTDDHIAYLTGYPGDVFGPDNSMTRAEVAQMFYALLRDKNVTITKTFPDVPADAWYATAVNTLASLGMVTGDSNGNFRPNDPITRAEFCVVALAFAYEPASYSCNFSDVARTDWFYPYVAQATVYGWIGGYTDGSFGPRDSITRAQVTTIVNNMLGRAADQDYVIDHQDELVQFVDLNRTHWAYYQIMEAVNAHDYTKTGGSENWR